MSSSLIEGTGQKRTRTISFTHSGKNGRPTLDTCFRAPWLRLSSLNCLGCEGFSSPLAAPFLFNASFLRAYPISSFWPFVRPLRLLRGNKSIPVQLGIMINNWHTIKNRLLSEKKNSIASVYNHSIFIASSYYVLEKIKYVIPSLTSFITYFRTLWIRILGSSQSCPTADVSSKRHLLREGELGTTFCLPKGGVGQMGKVKRESIEPLGTGLVLWQNQSKFQWSDRCTIDQCPSPANIPNGITEIGYKRWKNVVVGYFLDRALPLNLVKEWAYKTWEQALEDVMLLDNGFYVFKLRSEENCNAVLGVGPYHIAGKLLILKKCQPTGRASLQKQLC
ncbi:hypothetical protein DKX38_030124 (mitochondrion) [Salix brachista]|uniref:DUF4283 domain-containing protein n=1 Tax=Salix brachista TaxID=2182728 RepID=A0A5N5IVK8_9ROSI|nr:hypothetical protein DKX38_030124 [Salix brachista]